MKDSLRGLFYLALILALLYAWAALEDSMQGHHSPYCSEVPGCRERLDREIKALHK
jgi:hypothetical protein